MRILVTNDDGVFAKGLWALAEGLNDFARVIVVAPDREQSAIGTAVTLRKPLKIHEVEPIVPGIETYAVEGTPSDSVILALGKLVKGKVDLVISGINQGLNLGEDVLISGTVGAALQGYLHGLPSLAISTDRENKLHLDTAANVASLIVKGFISNSLPSNLFLNVNVPDLPLEKIGSAQITRLANESHINTVEETEEGGKKHYRLIRQRTARVTDQKTDIWALEQGNISITPLSINLPGNSVPPALDSLCRRLLQELQEQ